MRGTLRGAVLVWLCSCIAGCDGSQVSLGQRGADGAAVDGAAPADDAAAEAGADAIHPGERCAAGGSAVRVSDGTLPKTCAGRLAGDAFRYALCTCAGLFADGLTTRAFDSRDGGDVTTGAAVGVNARYTNGGFADVGGSLTVSGMGVTFAGSHSVQGDLRVGGTISGTSPFTVARDVWAEGSIFATGGMIVGRDLHQPSGSFNQGVTVEGTTVHEPVAVAPPCPCGINDVIDVPALVRGTRDENDNALIDLDPSALGTVDGTESLELPCGRFYLAAASISGTLTLRVTGRTALFVDGNLDVTGALEVEIAPEATFHLFVAGNLQLAQGSASLGSEERPSATRIYVGGTGRVQLDDRFVGNLYAPRAAVLGTDGFDTVDVFGSLFVRDLQGSSIAVHYDRAILGAGEDCDLPAPTSCNQCSDCAAGTACVDNICTTCTTDTDCCDPLVCHPDGSCAPLLI